MGMCGSHFNLHGAKKGKCRSIPIYPRGREYGHYYTSSLVDSAGTRFLGKVFLESMDRYNLLRYIKTKRYGDFE